jgi:methionyl-tRNA formyltransferase
LPYNRGAHPNFWAFYDNTPNGVTIHLIDKGLDTGPIVCQKIVEFRKEDKTFAKTYKVLKKNIEEMFKEILPKILCKTWTSRNQKGGGTFHFAKDLPKNFSGWNSEIETEIRKLKKDGLKYE